MIPERFRTIWGTRTFSTPCATRRWRRTDLKTSGRIKCSAGYGVGSEILRKSKCKNHRNNACKVTLWAFGENNSWNPETRYIMHRIPFDRDAIPLTPPDARQLLQVGGFEILRTDFLFLFPRMLKWLRGL